jgi:hypothetical protein
MAKVVAGLFDAPSPAREAIRQLERTGFSRDRIMLLNTDTAGEYARRNANETAGVLAGTAGGAGIAGIAGLLLGLATSGDKNDEAVRVLAGFDIPTSDADAFAQAIRNGKAVVIVQATDETAAAAQSVLDDSGAIDLESDPRNQKTRRIESEFRRDFVSRFEAAGYTYRQFAPAYRYGYQLSEDDLFRGKEWGIVEASAFRQWEHNNPNTWEQVKDAVKQGFLQN